MLVLKKKDVDIIIAYCKKELPNEACGILAGLNGKVEKVYELTNTDKSRETFFMDPKEQLKVMKEIRNSGLEMVGIFHSHPNTAAYPSSHDVELSFYPEVSYIIISLRDRHKPEIRSFRIVEGKIEEELIPNVEAS